MRRGSLHRSFRWPLFLAFVPAFLAAKGCGQSGLSCDERIDAAVDYVNSVIQAHSTCREDADCVGLYPSTDCMGVCMQAVNQDGVDAVNQAILYANQHWCQRFTDDGCGYATPGCVAEQAVCEQGQCVTVTGSSAARPPDR